VGKFSKIKKYSKPSLTVNEKIQELNKELEKTGMLSERMTTDALYQQGEYVPERGTDHTSNFEDAPEYISGGSKLLSTQSFTSNEFATIRRQFPSYTSRAGWKWIYISNIFRADWGNNINSFGETGGIGGYYTSMPDARLIAGGSVIRTSDPVVGYTTRYHPNNYPSTAPLQANLDDPDYLPVLDRNNNNMKRGPKDPWEELKKRLKAGEEWWEYMFGEYGKRARQKAKKIAELFKKQAEKSFNDFIEGVDGFKQGLEDFIDKASGIVPAGAAFDKFLDHQENPKHTKDNPYDVPFTGKQRENIGKLLQKVLDESVVESSIPNNKRMQGLPYAPSDIKSKIERGEKLDQSDIDWLNTKLNGADEEAYNWTFNNLSGEATITKNSDGSYTIMDNYMFSDPEDTDPIKPIAGPLVGMHAKSDRGDTAYYDKDPSKYPDAKKIGTLKKMYIKGKFPASGTTKEEITFEDIERQLILEELEYDLLIEKLEKQSCFTKQNKQEQTYKTIKRVSSATKDPSPILETKIIQTEQKSPSRFLAKEKREDTSRARWLKRA